MGVPPVFWLSCRLGKGSDALALYPESSAVDKRWVHQGIPPLIALIKSRQQDASTRRLLELLVQERVPWTDETGKSALEYAVEANAAVFVRVLLVSGHCEPAFKDRALVLAADLQNVPFVRHFLQEERADVNTKNPHGLTPLHMAIIRENRELFELLLQHGASPTLKNTNGFDAVLLAVARSKPRWIVQGLLQRGGSVRTLLMGSGMNAFQAAVYTKCVDNARLVKAFGGDAYYASQSTGYTAVHYAARNRDEAAVAYLLEEVRAPINTLSKSGMTPLDLALSTSAEVPRDLFKYMRARGADFSVARYCQHCKFEVMGWGCRIRLDDLLFLLRAKMAPFEEWGGALNARVQQDWVAFCWRTVEEGRVRQAFCGSRLPDVLEQSIRSFLDEPAWINAAIRETCKL